MILLDFCCIFCSRAQALFCSCVSVLVLWKTVWILWKTCEALFVGLCCLLCLCEGTSYLWSTSVCCGMHSLFGVILLCVCLIYSVDTLSFLSSSSMFCSVRCLSYYCVLRLWLHFLAVFW